MADNICKKGLVFSQSLSTAGAIPSCPPIQYPVNQGAESALDSGAFTRHKHAHAAVMPVCETYDNS